MQTSNITHQAKSRGSNNGSNNSDYAYGTRPFLKKSPLGLKEFELIKQTVMWSDDDTKYMRMSAEVLEDQSDAILDVWYDFFMATPHLAKYFGRDGEVIGEDELREPFKQWMMDTAAAKYDKKWLNSQHEIALQLHHSKEDPSTATPSALDIANFRYVPALIYPLTATLKPFLAKKHDHSAEDVECMHAAWVKSVIMQVCIWSETYVKDGDF